ncbi:MAG: DUF721 domain-containing protein [Cocleimonas sp.]|nr:DUF721 domain-containing protein [Cocleimonas sp.]
MKEPRQFITKYIFQRLGELNELSDSVAGLLQIDRNIHTLWVSIEKNKLLLMTDDSIFASQLRFQQDIICQHLNQKLLIRLKSVKIKVMATSYQPTEVSNEKRFYISPQTAHTLFHIAEGIDDEALGETLKRLSGS